MYGYWHSTSMFFAMYGYLYNTSPFLCAMYEYFYSTSTFFLVSMDIHTSTFCVLCMDIDMTQVCFFCFEFELLSTQPYWFTLSQWRSEKIWLTVYLILLPDLTTLFMTSLTHTKWQHSYHNYFHKFQMSVINQHAQKSNKKPVASYSIPIDSTDDIFLDLAPC